MTRRPGCVEARPYSAQILLTFRITSLSETKNLDESRLQQTRAMNVGAWTSSIIFAARWPNLYIQYRFEKVFGIAH